MVMLEIVIFGSFGYNHALSIVSIGVSIISVGISTPLLATELQGGHRTGKTGNLDVNFSRQGKHREFG